MIISTTTNFSTWLNSANISKNLVAGNNTIRITTTGQDCANIDRLNYEILQDGKTEAESASVVKVDCATNTASGWSGTGYAQFTNPSGSSMEWTVSKANASNVALTFRYANGSGSSRNVNLTVNGTTTVLALPATASWSTLANVTVTQSLNAGDNTIKLTSTGVWGGWMDYMSWSSSPSPNPLAVIKSDLLLDVSDIKDNGGLKAELFPNPAESEVSVKVTNLGNGRLTLKLTNLAGQVIQSESFETTQKSISTKLNLTNLSTGTYLISIKQGNKLISKKLIKK